MPVVDHPVHPSTRKDTSVPYQCWNRADAFAPHYWAPQRRFYQDGSFDVVSVKIPFRNSHACHHYAGGPGLGQPLDVRCAGCRHYKP